MDIKSLILAIPDYLNSGRSGTQINGHFYCDSLVGTSVNFHLVSATSVIFSTVNAPHKINGKQLDVKKALPKDEGRKHGGGRNDNWDNTGMYLDDYDHVQYHC